MNAFDMGRNSVVNVSLLGRVEELSNQRGDNSSSRRDAPVAKSSSSFGSFAVPAAVGITSGLAGALGGGYMLANSSNMRKSVEDAASSTVSDFVRNLPSRAMQFAREHPAVATAAVGVPSIIALAGLWRHLRRRRRDPLDDTWRMLERHGDIKTSSAKTGLVSRVLNWLSRQGKSFGEGYYYGDKARATESLSGGFVRPRIARNLNHRLAVLTNNSLNRPNSPSALPYILGAVTGASPLHAGFLSGAGLSALANLATRPGSAGEIKT